MTAVTAHHRSPALFTVTVLLLASWPFFFHRVSPPLKTIPTMYKLHIDYGM